MKARNRVFLAKEALKFYKNAKTVHQIDSPFIFRLANKLFSDENLNPKTLSIEKLRKELIRSNQTFNRTDFGKGSSIMKNSNKINLLGTFVKNSSISPFYGRLIHQLVAFIRPQTMLEFGTAAGISTAYLASGNPDSAIYTLEGDPFLVNLAKQNFKALGLENVLIVEGEFETGLASPELNKSPELVYIDGNHHAEAVIKYIEMIKPTLSNLKVVIIDDIRWSSEMLGAWNSLLHDSTWNVRLDLFRLGILIYNTDIKSDFSLPLISKKLKPFHLGLFR